MQVYVFWIGFSWATRLTTFYLSRPGGPLKCTGNKDLDKAGLLRLKSSGFLVQTRGAVESYTNEHTYIYIYMYTCTYVAMYIYIYVCIYIYITIHGLFMLMTISYSRNSLSVVPHLCHRSACHWCKR